MSLNQVQKDREAVLEAKKNANANNGTSPALTPAEVGELQNLQASR